MVVHETGDVILAVLNGFLTNPINVGNHAICNGTCTATNLEHQFDLTDRLVYTGIIGNALALHGALHADHGELGDGVV